jgi:S-formylglutathione hydrolase FrmB
LREEYCVLQEDGYNFVIGLSSGARGAVRLIQEMPDLFVSAAALSGDYDPSQMKTDNIYRGFLGEYEDHPERWEEAENLSSKAGQIRTPLYLGHGERDDFVPHTQSVEFYNVLRKENPSLNLRLNVVPDRGGSYAYWNYEISNIFRFFEQAQADLPEGSGR